MNARESNLTVEYEYINIITDTANLAATTNVNDLGASLSAYQMSDALVDKVEYWRWLDRNYSSGGMFSDAQTMQDYIAQSSGKAEWFRKQVQGKGYEWDWMSKQRHSLKNISKQYYAGDVANRAASDVTEIDRITYIIKTYQMKAYTSKTNPDLKNTPKDTTVVTNAEKVDAVRNNGYSDVEPFQTAEDINKAVDGRMNDVRSGNANTTYNVRNVGFAMGKAGLIGCGVGIGTETIAQYKNWKSGKITGEMYLEGVMKSGANAGITAAMTSGIMIPVSAMVTAAGLSALLTIPVAVVLGTGVDKIVAPCFGRGDYANILSQVKYYQNLDSLYKNLAEEIVKSNVYFLNFTNSINFHNEEYNHLLSQSKYLDEKINDLVQRI